MAEDLHKNLHEGHRKRTRDEFLKRGFDESTPPHKILELLLFYCIPRIDTNEIAHLLLQKYKSIAGVLDAPAEELVQFKGISENGAALIKLIMPIAQRYFSDKQKEKPSFNSLDDIGRFLLGKYIGITEERVSLLYLNAKGQFTGFEFISTGTLDSVGISMKDLIKRVLDSGATSVVMAHNHPSDIAVPSHNDCVITEMAADTLNRIGIRLVDHIILGGDDFVSMAQSSEYSHIFNFNT